MQIYLKLNLRKYGTERNNNKIPQFLEADDSHVIDAFRHSDH